MGTPEQDEAARRQAAVYLGHDYAPPVNPQFDAIERGGVALNQMAPPPPAAPAADGGWMQTAKEWLDPTGMTGKAVHAAGGFNPDDAIRKATMPGAYVPPAPRDLGEIDSPAAASAPQPQADPTRGGVQMQRPQVVGAAWTPGTHTVETKHGMPVPEDAKFASAAGFGLAQGGIDQTKENAIREGETRADVAAAERGRAQLHAVDEDRRAFKRDEEVKASMQRLEQHSLEIQSQKVDPEQYFKERGTAGAVTSAIAVLFGNIGMAFGAKNNPAMDAMSAAIDRNIKAQEANLANKRHGFADEVNIFKQNLDAFGTPEKARLASRVAYLDLGQKMLDERLAQNKTPEAEAAHASASAKVQQERARMLTDFAKLEHDDVTESMNEKFTPAHVVGGGPGASQIDPKLFVPTGPNGEGYAARTEDEAKNHRTAREGAMELRTVIEKVTALRAKTNPLERGVSKLGVDTGDMSEMKSLSTQAGTAINKMKKMGTWDAGAAKAATDQVGDLLAITGHPERAGKSLLEMSDSMLNSQERAQGGQGAQQQIMTNAAGQPVAVAQGQSSFASPRAGMPAGFKPADPRNAQTRESSPQKQQESAGAEPEWKKLSTGRGKK